MPRTVLSEAGASGRGLHRKRALGPFLCKFSSGSLRSGPGRGVSAGQLRAGLTSTLFLARLSRRGKPFVQGPGLSLLSSVKQRTPLSAQRIHWAFNTVYLTRMERASIKS